MENVDEKSLALLRSSYEMYEKTKKETKLKMKNTLNEDKSRKYSDADINKTIRLIDEMQSDVKEQYVKLGGDLSDLEKIPLKIKEPKKNTSKKVSPKITIDDEIKIDDVKEYLTEPKIQHENLSKALYDVIPLPSKGECYKHKIGKIPVSYLTAYDENLIVSPNLYRDGTFIDYLLKEKIMNSNIDPSSLTDGDRDAIILWLRASGYGNEFPVTATDNITGESFETVVDLSKIKFKEFKLKGDENGYFDFILPLSKDNIKFKFLTHSDQKKLDLMESIENKKVKKEKLNEINENLTEILDNEESIDLKLKIKINEAINTISNWADGIDEEDVMNFTHAVTNKLAMSIVSINDITDRKYINDYVLKMKVKDASALRKYITENEPGLDFNIEVEKPESLGGGSMSMFLSLDQYIFLNIA